jgi:hypothetical protein
VGSYFPFIVGAVLALCLLVSAMWRLYARMGLVLQPTALHFERIESWIQTAQLRLLYDPTTPKPPPELLIIELVTASLVNRTKEGKLSLAPLGRRYLKWRAEAGKPRPSA